jgi:hypothetical protein
MVFACSCKRDRINLPLRQVDAGTLAQHRELTVFYKAEGKVIDIGFCETKPERSPLDKSKPRVIGGRKATGPVIDGSPDCRKREKNIAQLYGDLSSIS